MVDALVKGIEKDSDGNIKSLILDDGRSVEADFFVDCTGFRRQLIQKELGAKWISYQEELPVNRALPFWLDHKPGAPIAPYTLAWAQSAGWIWFIPTQDRYGCGYVYSDAFLTPDQAKAEVEKVLGHPIEVRADIRMSVGRLENSVAQELPFNWSRIRISRAARVHVDPRHDRPASCFRYRLYEISVCAERG